MAVVGQAPDPMERAIGLLRAKRDKYRDMAEALDMAIAALNMEMVRRGPFGAPDESTGLGRMFDRPVAFGLRQQGKLEQVHRMRQHGSTWETIGKTIGWEPDTAREFYEREWQSDELREDTFSCRVCGTTVIGRPRFDGGADLCEDCDRREAEGTLDEPRRDP